MKPSGKYPALYYQIAFGNNHRGVDRIRIIYPDGSAEWRSGQYGITFRHIEFAGTDGKRTPCWHTNRGMSFKKSIKLMNCYDRDNNFPPAIYLGEIK